MEGAILIALVLGSIAWTGVGVIQEHIQHRQLLSVLDPARVQQNPVRLFLMERLAYNDRVKTFPDFLDLFGLGLSAGLTMDHAWALGVEKLPKGLLKEDLLIYEQFVEWGRSRREAFQAVCARLRDPQLILVLILIEQALKQGQELRAVVLDQARALRQRRWIQLERRAQTAGMRLLIPIFLFILPAVFLILLGPLYLSFTSGTLFQ